MYNRFAPVPWAYNKHAQTVLCLVLSSIEWSHTYTLSLTHTHSLSLSLLSTRLTLKYAIKPVLVQE